MKKFRRPKDIVLRQTPLVTCCHKIMCHVHHADTRIISGRPFIVHPLGVALKLQRLRFSEIDVASGLLHDCVEDHPDTCSFEEISARMDHDRINRNKTEAVILRIRPVTYDPDCLTVTERHEHYLEALNDCPEAAPLALADKDDNLADIICNLRAGVPVFGANYLNCDPREMIRNCLSIAALCLAKGYSDRRIKKLFDSIVWQVELIKQLIARQRQLS